MSEAKHEFVDDYPYLVYSSDNEATANGGTGGGGISYVSLDYDGLHVKAGELFEMVQKQVVFFISPNGNSAYGIGYICEAANAGDLGYHFSLVIPENDAMVYLDAAAATADDYPSFE